MALLCFHCSLFAQQSLSVGDSVPDLLLQSVLNESSKTARLSDFKDKLVILDFWATWCTSCLHGFPKVDSLQAAFGDRLKIVLVNSRSTGDNVSKVQAFFKKWEDRTKKKLGLITVAEDTVLERVFPHQLIPHYVWISSKRKVLAFSASDAITAANISAAIEGRPLGFAMKKDQSAERLIFSNEDLPQDQLLNYSVFIKGWFDGLPSGDRVRKKEYIICGKAFTNTALLNMYTAIAIGIDPHLSDKQVVAEDPDLIAPPSREEKEAWYREHAYTLDFTVPVENASQLNERMREALNLYSGYTGRFEKRKIKCLVLIRKDKGILFQSKGGKVENRLWDKEKPFLRNGNISLLVDYLNTLRGLKEFVVDGTGYTGNIDLEAKEGFSDLASIQRILGRYGLQLVEGEQWVKVFVVGKK